MRVYELFQKAEHGLARCFLPRRHKVLVCLDAGQHNVRDPPASRPMPRRLVGGLDALSLLFALSEAAPADEPKGFSRHEPGDLFFPVPIRLVLLLATLF